MVGDIRLMGQHDPYRLNHALVRYGDIILSRKKMLHGIIENTAFVNLSGDYRLCYRRVVIWKKTVHLLRSMVLYTDRQRMISSVSSS